ncbi:MAG: DMT family transporter [Casimicrobiaceae bacterium]
MRARDLARLVALAALWGGSFAFMRVAVPALGPIWLAWSRVTLAFATLLAFALLRGKLPSLSAHWRGYLVIGIVNSALPFVLFSFAEQYVTASTGAILNATSPFFGALAGAIWLGEALGARRLLGMALGLAGVVLLVGCNGSPWTSRRWSRYSPASPRRSATGSPASTSRHGCKAYRASRSRCTAS